jgi:hypothetical protein
MLVSWKLFTDVVEYGTLPLLIVAAVNAPKRGKPMRKWTWCLSR